MKFVCFCVLILWAVAFVTSNDGIVGGDEITTVSNGEVDRRRRADTEIMGEYATSQFSPGMIDAVVNDHNDHRADEPGADIEKIKWNQKLADMAQGAAEYCEFAHINYKVDKDTVYGQNIALFKKDISQGDSIKVVVDAWYKERELFDLKSNKCQAGEVCGHYLQMVLWDVSEMGCGYKKCPSVAAVDGEWEDSYIVYCHYNKIRSKGEKPYQEGQPCSSCRLEPGWKCVNNLCDKCDPDSDSDCTPYTCWQDPKNVDKFPAKKCALFKKKGRCTAKKNRAMMIGCPRTCELCPPWMM